MKKLISLFFAITLSFSLSAETYYKVYDLSQRFEKGTDKISNIANNNAGELTGAYTTDVQKQKAHPFYVDKDGHFTLFEDLQIKFVPLLNQKGQIAGTHIIHTGHFSSKKESRLFIWDPTDGFEFIESPKGWNEFLVIGFNDHGQILLCRLDKTSRYEPIYAYFDHGVFHLIDPSKMTRISALNNQGMIFGDLDLSGKKSESVFFSISDQKWKRYAPYPIVYTWNTNDQNEYISLFKENNSLVFQSMISNGKKHKVLPSGFYPRLINNKRQIIGNFIKEYTPAICEKGKVKEINPYLIDSNGYRYYKFYICDICSINDRGQMVAFGAKKDVNGNLIIRSFLLDPVQK